MKHQEWTLTLDAKEVLKKSKEQFKLDEGKLKLFREPTGWFEPDAQDPYKKFWDYFFDDTNFSCLSEEIKRHIDRLTGNVSLDFDYAGYLLKALKIPNDKQKSYKNKIKRWLADGSINIGREDAFRVCFALRMSPDKADDFLFKGCQQAGLNIRSTKDAIMFFCLLQNSKQPDDPPYSFDDINRIYQLCQSENEGSVKMNDSLSSVRERNYTTQRLFNEIENLPDHAFDTESEFINYINREADHFIGFSKTAHYHYNSIKLDLTERIIENEIRSIERKKMPGTGLGMDLGDIIFTILLQNLCNYMADDPSLVGKKNEIVSLKGNLSTLANLDENNVDNVNKLAKKNKLFNSINDIITSLFPNGFYAYFKGVKNDCMHDDEKRKRLYDCISINGFWVYLLPETFDTENKNRFGARIQKNFSQFRQVKYDKDPLSIKDNLTVADVIRKQIILMKCFEFIYSSMNINDDELYGNTYYSDIIDNVLNECGFYPLYSRHYFDCLILMTLQLLTAFEPTDALLFIRDAMAFEQDTKDDDEQD